MVPKEATTIMFTSALSISLACDVTLSWGSRGRREDLRKISRRQSQEQDSLQKFSPGTAPKVYVLGARAHWSLVHKVGSVLALKLFFLT